MKITVIACALLTLLASAGSQAHQSEPSIADKGTAAQTAGGTAAAMSAVLVMVEFVPRTVIEFCESKAPEAHAELSSEFARFSTRAQRAVAPYMDRLSADGSADSGPSADELAKIKQMMFASLAESEPHGLCARYLVRLRNADVDAMAADAWRKFEEVTAAAKARSAK